MRSSPMRRVLSLAPLLLLAACIGEATITTSTPTTVSPTSTTSINSTTTSTVDTVTLVEQLFGDDLPGRVVVASADSFDIWDEGQHESVSHPLAHRALQVEGGVVAVAVTESSEAAVVDLHDPGITYSIACPRLMTRGGEVLALSQCWSDRWTLVEVTSGEERDTPVPLQTLGDGEYLWFAERGGRAVKGVGDAEGNLFELSTLDGRDLLGDAYAGLTVLSTDGRFLAFVDHADPDALSHFWSPVVVVVDTGNGDEVGRWTLLNPVLCLEFSETWVVACEVEDPFTLEPEQRALVAINVVTGEMNRVETTTRVFLPG